MRVAVKLTIPYRPSPETRILKTNISIEDMAVFYLSKIGYGSVDEILIWDTPLFLDALEFENIQSAFIKHEMENK